MNSQELKLHIANNDKYEDILKDCGCHSFKNQEKYLRCSLDGKHNNSISLNKELLILKDFSGYYDGDIFSFVMKIKELSFADVIKYIHNILGLKYDGFKKLKIKDNKSDPLGLFKDIRKKSKLNIEDIQLERYDDNILNQYIPNLHIDWAKTIMNKTRDVFNIGYSVNQSRICIPHTHYETGEIVGVVGRTVLELHDELGVAKYFPLIKYKKSHNLYGLYENYKYIQKAGYVTVFEGEKSVLKRHTRFDYTCTSIGCHEMSDKQAEILKSLNVEVVIAFDKDVEMYKIMKNCERIYPLHNVSFILDRYDILKEKDSPSDANLKNYKKLFDNRINYTETIHQKFLEMKNKRSSHG